MDLSDRMKMYESLETNRICLPGLPVMVRLDGRCFHSFTRGLKRPFDDRFCGMMIDTATHLAKETNAVMAYTQSDEITLVLMQRTPESEIFFGGSIFKMTSVLASMCSVYFNTLLTRIPEKINEMPVFDCRVWNVPSREEAVNCLVWREQDATRNSIQMAAQSVYSQNQLHLKNCDEMQEMLFARGINWNDYPDYFKRGTYIQKRIVTRKFTFDEISLLPKKHAARSDPTLTVDRTEFTRLDMPPIVKITNRVGVVFDGESLRTQ